MLISDTCFFLVKKAPTCVYGSKIMPYGWMGITLEINLAEGTIEKKIQIPILPVYT